MIKREEIKNFRCYLIEKEYVLSTVEIYIRFIGKRDDQGRI